MRFTNYYAILGVEPDVDQQAIKCAYRRLARRYHPDVAKVKNAAKRFLLIQEAYAVLSDSEKRKQYDRVISRQDALLHASIARPAPSHIRRSSRSWVVRPSEGIRFVVDVFGIRIDASFGRG